MITVFSVLPPRYNAGDKRHHAIYQYIYLWHTFRILPRKWCFGRSKGWHCAFSRPLNSSHWMIGLFNTSWIKALIFFAFIFFNFWKSWRTCSLGVIVQRSSPFGGGVGPACDDGSQYVHRSHSISYYIYWYIYIIYYIITHRQSLI